MSRSELHRLIVRSRHKSREAHRLALERFEVDEHACVLVKEVGHHDRSYALTRRSLDQGRLEAWLVAREVDVRALAYHEGIFLLVGEGVAAERVRGCGCKVLELERALQHLEAVVARIVPVRATHARATQLDERQSADCASALGALGGRGHSYRIMSSSGWPDVPSTRTPSTSQQ